MPATSRRPPAGGKFGERPAHPAQRLAGFVVVGPGTAAGPQRPVSVALRHRLGGDAVPGQGGEQQCGDGVGTVRHGRFLGAYGQTHVPVLQPPAQVDRLLDDLPADGPPAGDDLRRQAAADGAVVVGPGARSGEPGPDEGFAQGEAQRDGVGAVLVGPFEGPHRPGGDRRRTARQVAGERDGVHGVGRRTGGALGHGRLRPRPGPRRPAGRGARRAGPGGGGGAGGGRDRAGLYRDAGRRLGPPGAPGRRGPVRPCRRPTGAAIMWLESQVRLGVRPSRTTYLPPRPKNRIA
ncbi:hypothetical protein GCM10010095_03990 [Streptomyces anthocyanicus]|nr:hypothetical protein [Streptomyces anthocyanicus]GGL22129.1 hypothetical protein GCM10010095_03990 [Streptomyces anthocyanicus]